LKCSVPTESKKGDEILIFSRPEDVKVHKEKPVSTENVFEGTIKTLIFLGEMLDCQVVVSQKIIRARLHPKSLLKEGERVYLTMERESLISIAAK